MARRVLASHWVETTAAALVSAAPSVVLVHRILRHPSGETNDSFAVLANVLECDVLLLHCNRGVGRVFVHGVEAPVVALLLFVRGGLAFGAAPARRLLLLLLLLLLPLGRRLLLLLLVLMLLLLLLLSGCVVRGWRRVVLLGIGSTRRVRVGVGVKKVVVFSTSNLRVALLAGRVRLGGGAGSGGFGNITHLHIVVLLLAILGGEGADLLVGDDRACLDSMVFLEKHMKTTVAVAVHLHHRSELVPVDLNGDNPVGVAALDAKSFLILYRTNLKICVKCREGLCG